jgi:hypothetical protein
MAAGICYSKVDFSIAVKIAHYNGSWGTADSILPILIKNWWSECWHRASGALSQEEWSFSKNN